MAGIDYEKILLDIIQRNNKNGRWLELAAVDYYLDWMEGDQAYIQDTSDYEPREYNGEISQRKVGPSYFCFYLTSEIMVRPYRDVIELAQDSWHNPFIAFAVFQSYENDPAIIQLHFMDCPGLFGYHSIDKEGEQIENELTNVISTISPELLCLNVDNTEGFEEKFCRLIDIIYYFVILKRLENKSFVWNSSQYHYDDDLPYEDIKNELWGCGGYDSIQSLSWGCDDEFIRYNLQRLCFIYSFMAVKMNVERFILQVNYIIEIENVFPNEYTLWYLNQNKESINDGDSQQLLVSILSRGGIIPIRES